MIYKILLVDDEKDIIKLLYDFFSIQGYLVYTALNGLEALEKVAVQPDIILLDINMPKMDGLEVCKKIRNHINCPIIFLTAKIEERDRINGLLVGGDDYIMKPFSLDELKARVEAHLRREERNHNRENVRFHNDLVINYSGRTVHYNNQEILFTKIEFDLIEFFSLHLGQVFDKESIYVNVWGYDGEGDSSIIVEHIRRIRQKISKYTDKNYIETVWGVGYKWIG